MPGFALRCFPLQSRRGHEEERATQRALLHCRRHPPFIHCLRINPATLDNVELDALYAALGKEEPQVGGLGGTQDSVWFL